MSFDDALAVDAEQTMAACRGVGDQLVGHRNSGPSGKNVAPRGHPSEHAVPNGATQARKRLARALVLIYKLVNGDRPCNTPGSDASGQIQTLGSQAFGESDHQSNGLVVRLG
jgi:hypothetical protein